MGCSWSRCRKVARVPPPAWATAAATEKRSRSAKWFLSKKGMNRRMYALLGNMPSKFPQKQTYSKEQLQRRKELEQERNKKTKDLVWRAESEATLTTVIVHFEEERLVAFLRGPGRKLAGAHAETLGKTGAGVCCKNPGLRPAFDSIDPECALIKQLMPGVRIARASLQTPDAAYQMNSKSSKAKGDAQQPLHPTPARKFILVVKGKAPAHAAAAANVGLLGEQGKVAVFWVPGDQASNKRGNLLARGKVPDTARELAKLKKVEVIDSAIRKDSGQHYVTVAAEDKIAKDKREREDRLQSMPGRTRAEKRGQLAAVRRKEEEMRRRKANKGLPPAQVSNAQAPQASRILRTLQWNADTLDAAKRTELIAHLGEHKPHVVLLQETETHFERNADVPRIPGYEVHWVHGEHGVAILVAEGVMWRPMPPEDLPQNGMAEAAGVIIYPAGGARPEKLISCYVPPPMTPAFDPAWIPTGAHLFADVNLHSRRWDHGCAESTVKRAGPAVRRLVEWIDKGGRTLLNDGRTTFTGRQSATPKTTPDITVARAGCSAKWGQHHDLGSDHMAIEATLEIGGPPIGEQRRLPKWALGKAKWDAYTATLENELQDFGSGDVEKMSRSLTNAVIRAARAHVPRGTRQGKPAKFWWCPEAEAAVKKRKEARKRAKRSGRPEDIREWKREERRCKYTIRKLKSDAWKEFCGTLDRLSDDRKIWSVCDALDGKPTRLRTMPVIREPGSKPGEPDRMLTDDASKAAAFAAGYAEVSRKQPPLRGGTKGGGEHVLLIA
eukprot:gene16992-43269_t